MRKLIFIKDKRVLVTLLAMSLGCPIALVHSQESFAVAPPSCAGGGPCARGDIGPGGGIVFFIAPAGTPIESRGASVSYRLVVG